MGCFVLSLSDCRGITTLSVCAQVRCCLSSKVLVELCSSCETSCSVQRVRKNRLMLHSRFCLFLQLDGSLSFLKVFMSYLIGLLLCLRCKVAEHKRMFGAFFFLVSCQTHKDLLSLKRSSVMQVKRQHLRCWWSPGWTPTRDSSGLSSVWLATRSYCVKLYLRRECFHHMKLKWQLPSLVCLFMSELRLQVSRRSAVLVWSRWQQNSVLVPVRRTSSVLQTRRRPRSGAGTPGAPSSVIPAVLPARTQRRHLEPSAAPVRWVRGLDQQRKTRGRGVRGQDFITQWLHSSTLTYGKVAPINITLLLHHFSS